MAAPKKDKNYINPPHRPPTFVSAVELWNTFKEYVKYVEENPIMKPELAKYKEHTEVVYLPLIRPLTKESFAEFCELSDYRYIKEYEKKGSDFQRIITRIENSIYANKFEGSSSGIFNPNIIARDLGLADNTKTDVTTKGESINVTCKTQQQANNVKDFLKEND